MPLDTGRRSIWAPRKGLKEKGGFDFFNLLVANERAIFAQNGKNPEEPTSTDASRTTEIIDLDSPNDDDQSKPIVSDEPVPMDGIEMINENKTTEWISKTEFHSNNDSTQQQQQQSPSDIISDEDKTLHELLDQVAELDEIYTDHQLRKDNMHIENELNGLDEAMPRMGNETGDENIDFDELFDDAATYTSLQIAFKNPISIIPSSLPPPPPPHAQYTSDSFHYDAVEMPVLINAPVIDVSPLKRDSPTLDDEKLPPLPPKRIKKAVALSENNENEPINNDNLQLLADEQILNGSRRGSAKSLQPRPQSQIIIMKTPNQSPLNKKLPPAPPNNSSNTLPKQKKPPGFFSKLFSRRKSKSDIASNAQSKSSLDVSREPSVHSFTVTDTSAGATPMHRASTRSNKSLQIPNGGGGPKRANGGKPVGRSVSSVSGKRPHLTADIVHIPLKGDSEYSLPIRSGSALALPGTDAYERASTATLSNNLDRKTVSALQLADLPLQDGNMELIAIADRQSLRNLCEGEFGVHLDPSVDLTEAEHYALYTSVAPHATESEFDEASCYYAPVEAGEILTQDEVARRLASNFS